MKSSTPADDGYSSPHMELPPPPYQELPGPPPGPPPGQDGGGADGGGGGGGEPIYPHWRASDPRSSSAHSLAASLTGPEDDRRTLLLVFIHGFLGAEASFNSFPAHVHSHLKDALADTHVVHTKIYPRYKTYRAVEVARDNFSAWLEPHLSETTDVILAGHSMGGILAGDVVLMPAYGAPSSPPFRHRILGTISFDCPFLGLHPGIITTGIASLFRRSPDPAPPRQHSESPSLYSSASGSLSPGPSPYSEMSSPGLSSPASLTPTTSLTPTLSFDAPPPLPARPDPLFNQPFFNDVPLRDRGWWRNVAHFAKKHRPDGLAGSAANHILSHLEFGGCLLDYPALAARYGRLRDLERVDDLVGAAGGATNPPQVRFVNYYTLSTGRPKPAPAGGASTPSLGAGAQGAEAPPPESPDPGTGGQGAGPPPESPDPARPGASTPRVSAEEEPAPAAARSPQFIGQELLEQELLGQEMKLLAPEPMSESEEPAAAPASLDPVVAAAATITAVAATASGESTSDAAPGPVAGAEDADDDGGNDDGNNAGDDGDDDDLHLPPIPDAPGQPPPPDLSRLTDPAARKQAEKEARRAQKAWEQAVKARERAVRERAKLLEKRRKEALKEAAQRGKKEEQERRREQKRQGKEDAAAASAAAAAAEAEAEAEVAGAAQQLGRATPAGPPPPLPPRGGPGPGPEPGPRRLRKFCLLPRDADPRLWVPVTMRDMDEVQAHCALFLPGPHYEGLVGDVGETVARWAQEDASKRAVRALA